MADGTNTQLGTEVGKILGEAPWREQCDRIPGCNDVAKDKGFGAKESDGGETGNENDGGNDNEGSCPPESDGPGPQPTCE